MQHSPIITACQFNNRIDPTALVPESEYPVVPPEINLAEFIEGMKHSKMALGGDQGLKKPRGRRPEHTDDMDPSVTTVYTARGEHQRFKRKKWKTKEAVPTQPRQSASGAPRRVRKQRGPMQLRTNGIRNTDMGRHMSRDYLDAGKAPRSRAAVKQKLWRPLRVEEPEVTEGHRWAARQYLAVAVAVSELGTAAWPSVSNVVTPEHAAAPCTAAPAGGV